MDQSGLVPSPPGDFATHRGVSSQSPQSTTSESLASNPTGQSSSRQRSLSGGHGAPPRIRRRNRLITSCLECRRRKLKCNKLHPCTNCTKFVRDCVYLASALDPASQLKLAEIKEKMGTLERTLENDVAKRATGDSFAHQSDSGSSDEDESPAPDDEKNLEPTPMAYMDAAYYEDGDDDLMDLGVQIGKMRITERIGGFVRPKITFELAHALSTRHIEDRFGEALDPNEPCHPLKKRPIGLHSVGPSEDYTAPASSFFFAEEPKKSNILQFLPSRSVADRLLEQYWEAVHYMARTVHRPSFERQWQQFWDCIQVNVEPPAPIQALVMASLLSGAISMSEDRISYEFGAVKKQLVDSFRQGTEMALYRANFLRTTKLLTLQALVMYLVALTRREVSRAHSAMTGAAIRLAECMGLHRDGTRYALSPVEVHVRRIIWYQLCFLDIRTCEATGPRPQIHKDDFDTLPPLNVNDIDLEKPNPPTRDSDQWTDMTFSLIRFRCNEMHRFIWRERPRLEQKKATLMHLLGKVQSFIHSTEETYLPMLNKTIPLQYMALLVYRILTYRMHAMVLHRYASLPTRPMPERLRKILLSSGLQQVECAILAETAPPLKKWSWYLGTFHQYHTALLLLAELYATPDRYFEDRIWDCLDFVFELPEGIGRSAKARAIFEEVMEKTQYYHSLRKVRAPQALEDDIAAGASLHRKIAVGASQTTIPTIQPQNQSRVNLMPSTERLTTGPNQMIPTEFGNTTFIPETSFYAQQTTDRISQSPPLGDNKMNDVLPNLADHGMGGGSSFNTALSGVDIDWNEWEKIFPSEVMVSDLGPPDFAIASFPQTFGNIFPKHDM